jgi:hypothetical protein
MTSDSRKIVVLGSLALIVAVLALCCGAMILVMDSPIKARVAEFVRGETPAAHIRSFIVALERDDLERAEECWVLPDWELAAGRSDDLAERRQRIIRDLSAGELDLTSYTILDIEWWSTCCMPGVTDSPRDAGGARARVQFLDAAGSPVHYAFDLFTLGGAYWGAATGWPARRWALRDVYEVGEEPLFWRMVWEPQVRHLD